MNAQSVNYNQQQDIYRDSIEVSYDSMDSFKDHLLYASMHQASIFKAMELVNQAEKLNNQKLMSQYDIKKIKNHFLKIKNVDNQNVKIRVEKSQKEITKTKTHKNQTDILKMRMESNQSLNNHNFKVVSENQKVKTNKRNPYDELQKAYMKLLSPSIKA